MLERELKRYAAYFRGWCQAFGDHDSVRGEESGIDWLLAGQQVGLVLPREMRKTLYREVLLQQTPPQLIIGSHGVRIGSLEIPLEEAQKTLVLDSIQELFAGSGEVHVYLTSHLVYGGGNRIITFSRKKPLAIIYKEIGTLRVRLERR